MQDVLGGVGSDLHHDAGIESVENGPKSGGITFQGMDCLRFEIRGKSCPEVGRVNSQDYLVSGEFDAIHHYGDVTQHSGQSVVVHELEIHGGMEAVPIFTIF